MVILTIKLSMDLVHNNKLAQLVEILTLEIPINPQSPRLMSIVNATTRIECVLTVLLDITLTPTPHVKCFHKIAPQQMSKVNVLPVFQDGLLRMDNVFNNSVTCHFVPRSTLMKQNAHHAH